MEEVRNASSFGGGERGPLVSRLGQIRGALEGGDLVVGKLEEEAALARGESAAVLEDEAEEEVRPAFRHVDDIAHPFADAVGWRLQARAALPEAGRPRRKASRPSTGGPRTAGSGRIGRKRRPGWGGKRQRRSGTPLPRQLPSIRMRYLKNIFGGTGSMPGT